MRLSLAGCIGHLVKAVRVVLTLHLMNGSVMGRDVGPSWNGSPALSSDVSSDWLRRLRPVRGRSVPGAPVPYQWRHAFSHQITNDNIETLSTYKMAFL